MAATKMAATKMSATPMSRTKTLAFLRPTATPSTAWTAFAHVQWTLTRHDGSALQQFHTGYQLLRTAQGPRVLLAVAHQENLSRMKPHAAE